MIKAVIFDFDGVIVDSKEAHLKAANKAISKLGIKITKKEMDTYFGMPGRLILKEVFKKNRVKASANKYWDLKNKIYLKDFQNVKLNKGAKKLIKKLSKQYKLAVVSNTTIKEMRLITKHYEIFKYFKFFIGWESTKRHKPNPEPYLKAAKRLGVKPSECVIVEDSPTGLEAAKRAKIKSIGLLTTNPRKDMKKASITVKDLSKTKRILGIIKNPKAF